MAAKIAVNPKLAWNTQGSLMARAILPSDGDATWKAGEFLRLASDGLLYESTTGTASGVGDDKIDYVALSDLDTATTGVDTNLRTVAVIKQDCTDVFEMNELDGTVARSEIGAWYPLNVTSNVCTVDTATENTHAIFEIVAPKWTKESLNNDSADTLALIYVKVLARTMDAVRDS